MLLDEQRDASLTNVDHSSSSYALIIQSFSNNNCGDWGSYHGGHGGRNNCGGQGGDCYGGWLNNNDGGNFYGGGNFSINYSGAIRLVGDNDEEEEDQIECGPMIGFNLNIS